jgi:hypothetical protein
MVREVSKESLLFAHMSDGSIKKMPSDKKTKFCVRLKGVPHNATPHIKTKSPSAPTYVLATIYTCVHWDFKSASTLLDAGFGYR